MGHLKHKYTKEYFTGQNDKGVKLNYGVEGYDAFLKGHIREIDLSVLERINFQGKDVLEFGFGRGEAVKYGIEHGATNYIAVDFASSAKKIATDFLKSVNIKSAKLYCDDALSFLKKYTKDSNTKNDKFDIILMFDFIEHVPREELKELFKLLKKVLKNTTIIAINTPNYQFDNDIIKNGLDERNNINTVDTSDLNDATSGMHCNKYSTVSLQTFMKKLGYLNITEQHFFILSPIENFHEYKSYKEQWNNCFNNGFPIIENYIDDIVESSYKIAVQPEWRKITKGILKDINLFITTPYQDAVIPNGDYDEQLFEDLKQITNHAETVFDVGGFMGVDSLIFSKIIGPKGKVIAFEPNPFNLNRILINLSGNDELSQNITVANLALNDKTGQAEFLLSSNIDNVNSSTSRLKNTHVEHSLYYLQNDLGFFYQAVKINTLDQFIEQTEIFPNVIKIDIEGAEHLFLLGAKTFLRSHSPILYIELHSQFCALTCSEILSPFGYKSSILYEEPDNRILVKYFKDKELTSDKTKTGINTEAEINFVKNTINILESKLQQSNQKLEKIEQENAKLIYLKGRINNPVIKIELKFFDFLKKFLTRKN